jgi:hypothetical protein
MVDGQLFVESLLSFYKGNRSLLNDLEPSYNEQHQQIRICPKESSKICPEQAA